MISKLEGGRGFWIGCGILVLGVLFLGFRGERAISTVLAEPMDHALEMTGGAASSLPDTTTLSGKSRLLTAAKPGDRDPFHTPSKLKPKPKPKPKTTGDNSTPKPRPKPKPKPVIPPTLRVLLFDTVDPCLKLTLKGNTSGWLRIGESFKGWTVTDIFEHSATVTKAGKNFVID